MGTIVVFDSADKCGKTEMAKELSRRLGVPYYKNEQEWKFFKKDSSYFPLALRYGDTYFYDFLKSTGTSVILDRSFPSEWVYSRVYNRQTDEDALGIVDELAHSAGAKIIVPYRTSYVGFKDEVHDIDSDHLRKISEVYEQFTKWTKCDVLRFCVDSEDIEEEMATIIEFLGRDK